MVYHANVPELSAAFMHASHTSRTLVAGLLVAAATLVAGTRRLSAATPRFDVRIAPSAHQGPLTGRLVLILAKTAQPEPRYAVSPRGPAIFGVDLEQLAAGRSTIVDDNAVGFPRSLAELPDGDYYAQAVVNVYEHVHRADGKSIWVHMNDGTVEFFTIAPGNLYSAPQLVHLTRNGTITITIDRVVPPAARPANTEWLEHVTVQSELLTKFWGRPIFVHAHVLLPKGYAEHPDVSYPSIYTLGHGDTPLSFSTTPPRNGAPNTINPATGLESGFATYQAWSGDGFPRVIAISLEQQTPYFPDSYSVNSANNGPYGDAIVEEIIPYLERHFRIIRQPYARHLEGASTSGWQSLAMQLQHPDFFGGAWIFQPDPIDFTRYQMTNIYTDTNAFIAQTGPFTVAERGFQRTVDGQTIITARQLSRFEAVLGSHGRSGYQLEAWEAVYGPVGDDGYPVPLWDKATGTIDHGVAAYMRDHGFDLRAYTERNWATLGPRLAGKLHFSAGDMDDYWLNLAVYRYEDFLRSAANPRVDADFTYGRPMKGHAWHPTTWADFIRKYAAAVRAAAPPGENARLWNY